MKFGMEYVLAVKRGVRYIKYVTVPTNLSTSVHEANT